MLGLTLLAMAAVATTCSKSISIPPGAGWSYLSEKINIYLFQKFSYLLFAMATLAGIIAMRQNGFRNAWTNTLLFAIVFTLVVYFLLSVIGPA